MVVAVTGADGTLLWVEGDAAARSKAERMHFAPGADWSERGAGTNAPGTALTLGREVQIQGSEHFSRVVQPWSCTAAPVHDPDSGALLGAIDLTGGAQVASPQTLALVRATAVAVENHLALLRPTGTVPEPAAPRPHLVVLGADRPRWVTTDEFGHVRATHLTGQHADILVLLAGIRRGCPPTTWRQWWTTRTAMSSPCEPRCPGCAASSVRSSWRRDAYRLLRPITNDVDEVFDAPDAGDVDAALARATRGSCYRSRCRRPSPGCAPSCLRPCAPRC